MLAAGKIQRRCLGPGGSGRGQINDLDDIGRRERVSFETAADENDLSNIVHHGGGGITVASRPGWAGCPGASVLGIEKETLSISAAHEHPSILSEMHPWKKRQPDEVDDRIPGPVLPDLLDIVNYDLTVSDKKTSRRDQHRAICQGDRRGIPSSLVHQRGRTPGILKGVVDCDLVDPVAVYDVAPGPQAS